MAKFDPSAQVPSSAQLRECLKNKTQDCLQDFAKTGSMTSETYIYIYIYYIYIYIYTNIARNSLLGGVSFSSVVLPIVFSCTGTTLCTSMSMDIFWKQLLQKISNILGEYPSELLKNCGL